MKGKFMPLAVCLVFMACQKQPQASFTSDKSNYFSGETVHLTNTSTDGNSYLWSLPDGSTSELKDIDWTISNSYTGTQSFQLTAFSKRQKLSSTASLAIDVSAPNGNVVFWQAIGSGFGTTTVTSNGNTSVITSEYPSAPNCGASGCATFNNWVVGTYTYSATDGTNNWNGSFTISKNSCTTKQLL